MLELNHQFRVVDVHASLDTSGDGTDAEDLEREMHQAGIVRSAAFAAPLDGDEVAEHGYVRANNALARRTVQRPLVAFARLSGPRDPGDGAGARLKSLAARRGDAHTKPTDVRQYGYNDRFHGFKLDPTVDGLPTEDVLDALDEVGLPVLVHGGEGFPPEQVADALLGRAFPVVLAHFGGFPLDRERMAEATSLLGQYDDLFLNTSAVRYRDVLEQAIREHPDRILFGSGAPAVHPSVAVMEILTLDVPEDAMARVFAKNAARVIEALGPDQNS